MRRWLVLLFLMLWLPAGADAPVITDAAASAMAARVRPLLEAETGVAFRNFPTISVTSPEELQRVLAAELKPQMPILYPSQPRDDDMAKATNMARAYSMFLLAKYDRAGNRVLVLADNFASLSKLLQDPRVDSEDFLRVTMIHELVHALDEQEYQAVTRLREATDANGLEIRNALLEGHAQFVTQRILEKSNEGELFNAFESSITAIPPGMTGGEALMAKIMASSFQFAYVDGRRFFVGLAQTDPDRPYVQDVFATPPTSKSVILHPETYYRPAAPKATAVDLKPLWITLEAANPDRTQTLVEMDEARLRAATSDFIDAATEDQVWGHSIHCAVLVLSTPGGLSKIIGVYEMDSPAAADACYQLNVKVLHVKDDRLVSGTVRITQHDYQTRAIEGAGEVLTATKTVVAGATTIQAQDTLLTCGRYVVEIQYTGQVPTPDEVKGVATPILHFLADHP